MRLEQQQGCRSAGGAGPATWLQQVCGEAGRIQRSRGKQLTSPWTHAKQPVGWQLGASGDRKVGSARLPPSEPRVVTVGAPRGGLLVACDACQGRPTSAARPAKGRKLQGQVPEPQGG